MKFKVFATDDWLARHPKVMLACAVIAFNAKTYIEAAAAIRARREQ